MGFEYSQVTPDIEAVYALHQMTGWYDENPIQVAELAQAIANTQFTVSAYEGEKLVGYGYN